MNPLTSSTAGQQPGAMHPAQERAAGWRPALIQRSSAGEGASTETVVAPPNGRNGARPRAHRVTGRFGASDSSRQGAKASTDALRGSRHACKQGRGAPETLRQAE